MSMKDYVIATGGVGDNNATWRKWASGVSEYWGREVLSSYPCSVSMPWYDTYDTFRTENITASFTYPDGLFCDERLTNTIVSFASSAGTPAFTWSKQIWSGTNTPTNRINIELIRPAKNQLISGRIQYYCKGYWKYPDIPKRRVGGKIFHIVNSDNGALYKFYDANGNELSNVQVGDEPYEYRVYGVPSCDKYYVFNDELFSDKMWTYYSDEDEDYVFNNLGTGIEIGKGKNNTAIVMAADNGAYITTISYGYRTVWYQIKLLNDANTGGMNDWYAPSKLEAEALRNAVDSEGEPLVDWFDPYSYIWSSSESDAWTAWSWYADNESQAWDNSFSKESTNYMFAIRSF